jgi:hypothetical protein
MKNAYCVYVYGKMVDTVLFSRNVLGKSWETKKLEILQEQVERWKQVA